VSGLSITLLVCGDRMRGDDGAALAVLQLLRLPVSGVDVCPVGQLEADDLLALDPAQPCVIVDAVAGVPPGSVIVRPLHELAQVTPSLQPASSHGLPPTDALALAGVLRDAPPVGAFIGIGGARFGLGDPLSTAVRAGLPGLAETIEQVVATFMAAGEERARCA
jgi:hydrogenase maturation protease